MRCELSDEEKAASEAKAKEEADSKAAADAKAKADAEGTEGRISALAQANKELKAELKKIADEKKAEEEAKLLKKGEHEKLLETRNSELATEKKAREDFEAKVKKYEDHAKKQIDDSLKSITDADKQKSAQAMLAGRSTEEQITLLPEVMKLAGGSVATTFGGATPASTTTPTKTDLAQKKAKYEELLAKKSPTPQELRERHTLMVELQKVWNEEQEKKIAS